MIRVKRVYDPPSPDDGRRFLVDRLRPRGIKKEALQIDGWLKEVAPSDELRQWFGHDPARWEEFQRRYFAELEAKPEVWQPLLEAARQGPVTLLYSARDEAHNNAVALKMFLDARLERARGMGPEQDRGPGAAAAHVKADVMPVILRENRPKAPPAA